LRLAALPYEAVVRGRNAAYRSGLLRSYQPPVPVISIGNITAGGVGKTPFVETIVEWLSEAGRSPVIVSRGYGSRGGDNDEAMLLRQNLPATPHLQNPDRVAAVQEAAAKGIGNVVVLDDGFQHRRLRRTVDIVLLDATDPFGGGRVLPAGFLREPVSGLARADAIVLTRAGMVDEETRTTIRQRVAREAPAAVWGEVDFRPTRWDKHGESATPLASLQSARVMAFCGIGNPEAFRGTLDRLGNSVVGFESFPDHHRYSSDDLTGLARLARQVEASALVATQKDAVKITRPDIEGIPFYSLRIATEFASGESELRQLVSGRVAAFAYG